MVGKICPNPYVYNTEKHTWQAFKEAVEKSNIKEAGIIANADGGMQHSRSRGNKHYVYLDTLSSEV